MRLQSGEGRKLELEVVIEPFTLAAESYAVSPSLVPVRLDISRTTGAGYALRLRFDATLEGPCMRCLEPAALPVAIDAREISMPGEADELSSEYVEDELLDLGQWARDAVALALPATILCRAACAGLCPVCGENLNTTATEHRHGAEPDPRWARLSEVHFD